jgi:GNAT superfamily N-acetyltransferase
LVVQPQGGYAMTFAKEIQPMQIDRDNRAHLDDFVRLNELWITEYFALEDGDRSLASNPGRIIDQGGFIFSLVTGGEVAGVCALFKEDNGRYQLARMAVERRFQGRGYGRALMECALSHADSIGAKAVFLLTNTRLETAIHLYKQFGFLATFEGQHPEYSRCNLVMERQANSKSKKRANKSEMATPRKPSD